MLKDFEIGLPSKLPSKKDDLFCFSFNFENLIKTIDYLHKYNLALFSKLQNFNERMIKFEEIATEFPKVKEEIQNLQLYSKEHENLIKENQNKINENGNKIDELSKKIDKNKINIYNNEELINENKKNIDILLKDKNEREKKLAEEEESKNKNNDNKNKNKNTKINFDEIKKYMEENVFKGANDKEIESLKHNVNNINEKLKEIQINVDSSKNQMERHISNILNSIINKNEIPYQVNSPNNNIDGNLFKMTMAQIEKYQKYTQDMMDQFNTSQEKIKQDIIWINNDISENKKYYKNLKNSIDEYLEDKRYYLTFNDIKEISKNVDELISKIKDFSCKTDLETIKTDFNIKFNKMITKIKDLEELKNNKKKHQDGEWDPEDLNFVPVTKRISELISELLKTEGKNIDLTKNKHFVELMKLNQNNKLELNKNMQNYLDLKTLISSNLSHNDIEQLQKENANIKNDIKYFKNKLEEITKLIGGFETSSKSNYDEKIEKEIIEGDKNVEIKIRQSEKTIQGKIEFITDYIENLSNKLMKIEKKLNSITKDLKDDMKNNLRLDTYKVIEQFKVKLNSFTDKFENELKNKIDKMGLNVFENKLNHKLSFDLKDKLNKNDLKKNNYMINKKIDTLENKISKTLVDTIIDLQMEDAPLILKKNQRNVELCASCNRPLNDNNIYCKTIEHIPTNTSTNFMKTPRRNHLRNIASLKKLPVIPNSPK